MRNFYVNLAFVLIVLLISVSVNAETKCGVNSFAVFEECALDYDYNSDPTTTYDANGNVIAVAVSNIVYEPGYKYAKYECYDGTVYREGGESSCKSSGTWADYARRACENKCSEEIIVEEPVVEIFDESVKCIFVNAKESQSCYASDWSTGNEYTCSIRSSQSSTQTTSQTNVSNLEDSCVVEGINGKKGTALTWKSTCGGYAYTVIDGENESIRFDCTQSTEPVNPNPETFCTREYVPVCGETKVICVKAPCEPIKITYPNKCELEKANARYLYAGECKEDEAFIPQNECMCTMEYAPVCAVRSVCESKCYAEADRNGTANTNVIVTSDGSYTVKEDYTQKCESSCYEQKETYSNSCQAECAGAKIIYRGECGTQAQCQKQDYEAVRMLKDRCYSANGKIVELEDSQGCPYYDCIVTTTQQETNQCRTKEDIVEKVASCENEGGKFYGRFDEQGCLVTADCIREGRVDSNVEVTKVPSATVLLEMALKLEDLKIEFGQLKSKIAGIADYYRAEGDTNTAEKFDKVVEIIVSAQNDISLIKEKISQNIDSFDLDMAIEIKEAIRRINEERITEIVKVILSS